MPCTGCRIGNGLAKFLFAHGRDDLCLSCDCLVESGVALCCTEKITSNSQNNRNPNGPRTGGTHQIFNEGVSFLRILTKGIDLFKLVDQNNKR